MGNAPDPADFAAVLVVGSVHVGKHESELQNFVRKHRHSLARVPSAFYSVSLSAAKGPGHDETGALRQAQSFLDDCAWTPDQVELVAGALRFSRYGFLTGIFMQQLMRRIGVKTDRHHDTEYTDWKALDRAVADLISMAEEKNAV
jgi:menaquinone-dependent protoporphyrinogen oxidase